MGQAKKRGTFEERQQQALERQKREHEEWKARQALMPKRSASVNRRLPLALAVALGVSAIRIDRK